MFSGCSRQHHSLLHPPLIQGEASTRVDDCDAQLPALQSPSSASGAGEEGQCTAISSSSPRVGFRIVPVKVRGSDGRTEVETYAFLDNGSDTTLCLNGLAQRLGLNETLKHFSLLWLLVSLRIDYKILLLTFKMYLWPSTNLSLRSY